jgi:hypothetical protein
MPFAPGRSGNLRGRPKRGDPKIRAVANALVEKAMAGDVGAIREIADQLDGRPKAAVDAKVEVQSQPIIIQMSEADLAGM